MKPAQITKLADFSNTDRARTLVYLVWEARALLSEAEREVVPKAAVTMCDQSVTLLDAALMVVSLSADMRDLSGARLVRADSWAARCYSLIDRAKNAAQAAGANGRIAHDYAAHPGATAGSEGWDEKHAPHARAIGRRAVEAARSEAHRALAELCEQFPHAMPTE